MTDPIEATAETYRAERDRLREELAEAIRRGEDQWTGWIKAESRARTIEAERDAARAEVERLTEALFDATASLVGAASAYRSYAARHRSVGRAAPDPFFTTRARDFDNAATRARAALSTPTPTTARDDPQE